MRRLVISAAFGLGLLVAALPSLNSSNRPASPGNGASSARIQGRYSAIEGGSLLEQSTPLIGGEETTLEEAEGLLPFEPLRPQDILASDGLIAKVWVLISERSILAIQYTTGVTLYLEAEEIGKIVGPTPGPGEQYGEEFGEQSYDPPADFDELAVRLADQEAEQQGSDASKYLARVKGNVAFVLPYVPGSNTGMVEFSFNGVRVKLMGDFDLNLLLKTAESVA